MTFLHGSATADGAAPPDRRWHRCVPPVRDDEIAGPCRADGFSAPPPGRDNAATIVSNEPAFARVYLEEKRMLLTESLTLPEGLDEPLRRAHLALQARAWQQLESGEGALDRMPKAAFRHRRSAPHQRGPAG